MLYLSLDSSGHLRYFRAVPPSQAPEAGGPAEPDWNAPLLAAGLDVGEFAPVDPIWTPLEVSDARRAWVNGDVRVEAAAMYGRLVSFEVVSPARTVNTGEPAPRTFGQLAGDVGYFVLFVGITVFAAFVARRNIRLGRGDTKGAWRLALLFLGVVTASNLLMTSNSTAAFFQTWINNFAPALLAAAWIWIGYLAIEPYVRRLWPQALVTWSRVLEGRLRDPRVGRDLLFGGAAGMLAEAIFNLPEAAPLFGLASPVPIANGAAALGGPARWLASLLAIPASSFITPVIFLLVLLLARLIFRKPWLAYLLVFAVMALFAFLTTSPLPATPRVLILMLGTAILTRLGLFAMMVTIAFSSWAGQPLTLDPASWYFPYSLLSMVLFAGIAVYGFIIALGDRLTFKDSVLD
jgi:hypothetical protein